MRLFGKIDNAINRFDRAQWLTPVFDLAFGSAAALPTGLAMMTFAAKHPTVAFASRQPTIAFSSKQPLITFTSSGE